MTAHFPDTAIRTLLDSSRMTRTHTPKIEPNLDGSRQIWTNPNASRANSQPTARSCVQHAQIFLVPHSDRSGSPILHAMTQNVLGGVEPRAVARGALVA